MSLPARASLSRVLFAFLPVLAVLLWYTVLPASAVTGPSAGSVHRAADYGAMPLLFIPNQGQFDSRVAYAVQGRDTSIFFSNQGLTFVLSEQPAASGHKARSLRQVGPPEPAAQAVRQRWALKVDFVDANPVAKPESLEQAETLISYFKGRPEEWRTGLQASRRIIYRDLWPGIDLVYSGTVDHLKYDFIVHPGADPDRIRLAWRGADSVQVTEEGQLAVTTPLGTLRDKMPVAWQEGKERQEKVTVAYDLLGPAGVQVAALATDRTLAAAHPREQVQVVGFTVGDYDRTRTLVLDPEMLVYCGFIGGSGIDAGFAIAVDKSGNAYVTGNTFSGETSFPETVGPDLSQNGNADAFVAKVKADGTGLTYCGFIGGTDEDYGMGIAVGNEGNAYVTGYTASDDSSFPAIGGLSTSHKGGSDVFVAKVNTNGSGLVYCGFIGGAEDDEGRGIAVDSSGNAYVTGFTSSTETTFPETKGPDLSSNGKKDAFIAKVNTGGSGLDYCGFIGGTEDDEGRGIAVDSNSNAYVTGYTNSTETSFPKVVGPDLSHNGGSDVFVAKVKGDGSGFGYCGFIGGIGTEYGYGIAVDSGGSAYVTGFTTSANGSFPVIGGPDLSHNGGEYDAFVTKVQVDGKGLILSGFLGGAGLDEGRGLALDSSGNTYVTGYTGSTQSFPVTIGPDLSANGNYDAFIAKVRVDDFPWPAFLPAILEGGKKK